MIDTIMTTDNVSFIFVFIEGLLSFFSPCVIPLIPIYMSYLAGNTKNVSEDGIIMYERKSVFFHTLFFVLGILFSFYLFAISFTTLGYFFNRNKILFTRIGGIIIIAFGLFQLGAFNFKFLQRERKIHINFADKKVNPFMALLMGFTFSFAWTPCVGPMLSSVLIMASGARTSVSGILLVLIYALGFVLPFLLLGLFTTQVLQFLKSKKNLIKYTIKAGGIILILMGIMTYTGWMNGVSSYLNSYSLNGREQDISDDNNNEVDNNNGSKKEDNQGGNEKEYDIDKGTDTDNPPTSDSGITPEQDVDSDLIAAFDFTLTDQYGNEHTLSDYKGKVVFLNFWATWCSPCRKEMPHIEELYKEYNYNKDDIVILGVVNPKSKEYPNNQDDKKDEITYFLEETGYTFPTVFDETGEVFGDYNITGFPTTFMIDKEGNIFGYVPGMMTKDIMNNVINQTLQSGD